MGVVAAMNPVPCFKKSPKIPSKSSPLSGSAAGLMVRCTKRFAPAFACFAFSMGLAHGASLYWDTNGATSGFGTMGSSPTGVWGSDTFWSTSSAGTVATTGTPFPTNADDVNFNNTGGGTVTIGGAENAHSITFNSSSAITLAPGTSASIDLGSAVAGSGIFEKGTGSDTISTAINLDASATGVSFSNTSTGTLTISGSVTGNATSGTQILTLATSSTGGVVVSGNITDGAAGGAVGVNVNGGTGLVTLSGANNYNGPTTVASGTLLFVNETSLYNNASTTKWTAANLTVASGATAAFNVGGTGQFTTTDVTTLLSNLTAGNGNGLLAGSSIGFNTANASGSTFTISNNITDSTGTGGGSIGVTKLGAGVLVLSGSNGYSGVSTVSGGVLQFAKEASLYGNVQSSWTASNITVNSGTTVAFNVGGANQFTNADVTTLLTNLSTINNNGLKAGSSIGFDTTGATGSFTISNIIANSTGTGGGAIGVTKLGTNTLVLSGPNTYTGGTLVANGAVNVLNDQSAATGGWTISDSGLPASGTGTNTPTANFQAGSTVVIASGKAVSLSTGNSFGEIMTINAAGTVTNNGTLSDARQSAVNINSGGNWTQNGTMSVATSGLTYGSASMTVNTGGTFTYTGSSAITLGPSSGGSGNASLTVAGGTFVTGMGFSDTVTSGTGSANLVLSTGGTLRLSANIATLATVSAGGILNVNVGTGGGTIDTNGFSTTISQGIANVSGQTGSLTKAGNGKLTLSNASNAYTGTTTVNGGTLVVSGSLSGTTSVSVASGATLASGATGSITTAAGGNISVSGTLAPGDIGAVGTLTLAPGTGGQLSFASGSTLALDISGANSDQIAFASAGDCLLGSGNATLSLGGLTAANYTNTYTIFSNVTTSGFSFASITGYDSTDYRANITQVGNAYQLSFAAVPEPGTTASLVGGLGLLLGWQRRRPVRKS